jgi:hypothetical protein
MKFPTLYKKSKIGAIQYWKISLDEYDGIGIITTEYGQLGTDSPEFTDDYIEIIDENTENINETTPYQQAEAEALSRWIKQCKHGYIESLELAKAEK